MTTRPCDFFGGSAKSVLNKPLLHAIQRVDAGVGGGTSLADGYQDRVFNEILTNEIPGAVVASNEITLPAGEYYILARASGYRIGVTNVRIVDSANASLINGSANALGSTESASTDQVVSGRLTITETTKVIKLRQYSQYATANSGLGILGSAIDAPGGLVHAEISIWKIDSNVETPVISDPSMVLARPLMHVQDQKPSGTGTPISVAGWQDRELNTTLTNDIAGASLGVNAVTLPAGTYDIVGRAPVNSVNNRDGRGRLAVTDDVDSILILGQSEDLKVVSTNDITGVFIEASGRITLAATTTIKLRHYTAGVHSNVLGRACSTGENEVYADLQIRQLDSLIRQPVLVNDKLYPLPGNVIVTGNMHGLEYEYDTVSTFTVQAGICMDSLNETVLTLQNPQLVDLNNATQNPQGLTPDTIYNIFLTDDSQLVKVDTDVNGANLPVGDKRRWIGFVLADSSGAIARFQQDANQMQLFEDNFGTIVATISGTTLVSFSLTGHLPPGRIETVSFTGGSTAIPSNIFLSVDGITKTFQAYQPSTAGPAFLGDVIYQDTFWGGCTNGTTNYRLFKVTLKR